MKKLVTFFLALVMPIMLWAYDFQSGDLYYNITSNVAPYTVEVTSGNTKYSGDITIPSSVTYNGITYAVTGIGSQAFYFSSLTSVTIPNSVTSIGTSAFEGCSSLTSVTIPNSVKSIGDYAFSFCFFLTSVTIPNSVTSIGNYAFNNCSSLTSVTIPNSVTSIGSYAFYYCFSLTSVTIPSSVTSIGSSAFYYCVLSKDKFINNSACTSNNNWGAILADKEQDGLLIKDNVVVGCKKDITTVTIPNGIVGIGRNAFYNCSSLTSVTIPNSVTRIEDWTFSYCSSLTSVTIPSSVTSIANGAFSGCYSLTSVTIPSSVTSIGSSSFQGCSSLTSVTIPSSVTSIGELAFVETGIFNDNSNWENGVLYISNCLVAAKESLSGAYTIKDGTRIIAVYAFNHCSSLTSVTIPNSVTSIGTSAFYGCSSLTSVTIPSSLTSIGGSAFYGCSSLTSVTIPNSVTSIRGGAFYGCSSLTSVTIPNSVTSIGNGAFVETGIFNDNSNWENGVLYISNCLVAAKESLSGAYTIKNGTRIIADYAFIDCSSLTSVTIPSSVTSIGRFAFSDCSSLNTIYVEATTPPELGPITFAGTPSPVCHIPCGTKAAYEASAWASKVSEFVEEPCEEYTITYTSTDGNIVTPNKADAFGANIVSNTYENGVGTITFDGPITSIGSNAFSECSSLTSIIIPNSVTSIGSQAFMACPNIVSMVVENGNPFYDSRENCNAIIETATNTLVEGCQNTIIPKSVTKIGDYAFSRCTSLKSIFIHEDITSIDNTSFVITSSVTSIIVDENNNIYDSRNNCNAIIETSSNTLIRGCENTIIPNDIIKLAPYSLSGIIRESLTIPKNVNNIEGQALLRTNIGKIFLNSYTPIPLGYSMEVFPFTCHIPCGTKAAYEASAWANYVSEFVEDCDNGSYSRTVRIGYNTICLPHGSSHFTGATFYEIAHILKNDKKIFFDEAKTLEAGKPYIFYPHSTEVTIYYDNTTSAIPLSHNGLHGTFDGITAASNFLKGKYLVAGNRMVLCGDGCSLAANRAYIVLDEISDKDHPDIPGIKRVSMDYSEENATTALDNITDESIVAPMQEGVYDILGRKVDAPTVTGFYIINGKKVFVMEK